MDGDAMEPCRPQLRIFVDGDATEIVRAVERDLVADLSGGTTYPQTLFPLHERLAELEGE
jgi:hypothetical protein